MADRENDRNETFFARWSRVKSDAREAGAAVPVAQPQAPDDEPPELPAIEDLTLDSDFKSFLHPKVDEDVRRQALRKLFSDPHFNVMDGLDVYIDDYSKTEPIPAAMLAGLQQAQRIFQWAAETKEQEKPAGEDGVAAAAEDPAALTLQSAEAAPSPIPTTSSTPKPST